MSNPKDNEEQQMTREETLGFIYGHLQYPSNSVETPAQEPDQENALIVYGDTGNANEIPLNLREQAPDDDFSRPWALNQRQAPPVLGTQTQALSRVRWQPQDPRSQIQQLQQMQQPQQYQQMQLPQRYEKFQMMWPNEQFQQVWQNHQNQYTDPTPNTHPGNNRSQYTSAYPYGNENYSGGFMLEDPAYAHQPAHITNGADFHSSARHFYPAGNSGTTGGQGTQSNAVPQASGGQANTTRYNNGNSYGNYSTPTGRGFNSYRASGRGESGGFGTQEPNMFQPAPRTPYGTPKIRQQVGSKTKKPHARKIGQEKKEDKKGSSERKDDRLASGTKAAETKRRTVQEKMDRDKARKVARDMRAQAHINLQQGVRKVQDQIQGYIEGNPNAQEDLGGLEKVMNQLLLTNNAQHEAADAELKEVEDELEEKYRTRHKRESRGKKQE
ncbi:hypothetical protein E4T39_02348 [Aureobasidium subglaciale]|nr:hypothetical protein E4T39_02348 [Aureobasidium subglaciale]